MPGLDNFLGFCQTVGNFNHPVDLLEAAAALTPQLLAAEGSIVLMKDAQTRELYIPAACMKDAALTQHLKSTRFDAAATSSGAALHGRTPLIDGALEYCPEGFHPLCDHLKGKIRNRLIAPLEINDEIIGTIWAVNKTDGPFISADAQLLYALAGVTAMTLESMAVHRPMTVFNRPALDLDQARDHAAQHLSHAIKTPLSVLIASLKLLEKYLKQSPLDGWQPIARRAQRNLERLLAIEYEVEDILRQKNV